VVASGGWRQVGAGTSNRPGRGRRHV